MSRKRDRGSLDEFIEKKVEDKVDEALEEQQEESFVQGPGLLPPDPNDPVLKRLLSSFPSTQGYYGKLYKILPSGKEEMKHVFQALEEMADPEVEVSGLAKERRWGSGDYRLRVYQHGASGMARSLGMRIDVDDPNQPGIVTSQPEQSLTDKLKELSDIVQTAREILPKVEAGASEKMGQTLAETFKSGVDVVKEALGPQKDSSDTIVQIFSVLKDLGVFSKPEPVKQMNEAELIEKTLKNLKEMGLLASPKSEDATLDKLIKLREAGLVKFPGEDKEDALSIAEKIKPIIELVSSLGLGGASPERATFWTTIAPHVPTFIEKLATPFKDYLELRKMEIQQNMRKEQIGMRPLVRQGAPGSTKEELPVQEEAPPQQLHPIISEILNAVQSRDHNYFPKLKELLALFVGPHVVEALLTKQVSVDTFMSLILNSPPGQVFSNLESRIYLQEFVNWLESQESAASGNGMIGVKCNTCHEEFEMSKEDWERDDKKCECGNGVLEEINPASV